MLGQRAWAGEREKGEAGVTQVRETEWLHPVPQASRATKPQTKRACILSPGWLLQPQWLSFRVPVAAWYLRPHFSGQEVVEWLTLPGGQASSEDRGEQ